MARIDRRRVLQLSGAGAVAAATGGIAGILASGRAPAFAQGTTLHWVRGSDYVPVSDQMVRTKLNELAQKELGLKINLEGVDGLTIQARVASAVSSGSGPDIICALNNWAQLEWGAGGGLGIVTGKLMRIVNTSPGCSANPSDPTQCYPMICGGGPCTDAQLAMHQAASSCHDKSCAGGNQFEDGNVPPAIPIIHLLVGGVFQLSDKIRLRVEGGFHDAFFFGAASEYAL